MKRLTYLLIIFLMFTSFYVYSAEKNYSYASFTVLWYDVGKAALEEREGVFDVQRLFKGSSEVNTVKYDPAKITVEEMETYLKRAGTYIGTLEKPVIRDRW